MLQKSLVSAHNMEQRSFLNHVFYKLIDITDGFNLKKETLKQFLNRNSIKLISEDID